MIAKQYIVTFHSHGHDCDGPIDHGTHRERLNFKGLTQAIGREVLFKGLPVDSTGDTESGELNWSNAHDEGFSASSMKWEPSEQVEFGAGNWLVQVCRNNTSFDTFNEETFHGELTTVMESHRFETQALALEFYNVQKVKFRTAGVSKHHYCTYPKEVES
jgi:hypothetical protein